MTEYRNTATIIPNKVRMVFFFINCVYNTLYSLVMIITFLLCKCDERIHKGKILLSMQ